MYFLILLNLKLLSFWDVNNNKRIDNTNSEKKITNN